jgi:hypothetical protein
MGCYNLHFIAATLQSDTFAQPLPHLSHARLWRLFWTRLQSPTRKLVDGINVDRIHIGTVVGQHGGQRSTDNFRPINDSDGLALQLLADGFGLVVAVWTVLEYFHHTEGSARQQTLFFATVTAAIVSRIIQVANVAIEIEPIGMTEAFDVASEIDAVSKIVVLTGARKGLLLTKDGIVDNDTVYTRIVVSIEECVFNVDGVVELTKLIAETVGLTSLSSPFGVLFRGRILVG